MAWSKMTQPLSPYLFLMVSVRFASPLTPILLIRSLLTQPYCCHSVTHSRSSLGDCFHSRYSRLVTIALVEQEGVLNPEEIVANNAVERWFANNHGWRFCALGFADNFTSLHPTPFSVPVDFLDASVNPEWLEAYAQANKLAFGQGALGLPGWVLVDVYCVPTVIGMLTCPKSLFESLPKDSRPIAVDDRCIAAAYVALPCLKPGVFSGCSLLSLVPKSGAAWMCKLLTLRALRCSTQIGVTQWNNRAVKTHCSLGPLKIVGRAPAVHSIAHASFVYSIDLSSNQAWVNAATRSQSTADCESIRYDEASFKELLAHVARGSNVFIHAVDEQACELKVRFGLIVTACRNQSPAM